MPDQIALGDKLTGANDGLFNHVAVNRLDAIAMIDLDVVAESAITPAGGSHRAAISSVDVCSGRSSKIDAVMDRAAVGVVVDVEAEIAAAEALRHRVVIERVAQRSGRNTWLGDGRRRRWIAVRTAGTRRTLDDDELDFFTFSRKEPMTNPWEPSESTSYQGRPSASSTGPATICAVESSGSVSMTVEDRDAEARRFSPVPSSVTTFTVYFFQTTTGEHSKRHRSVGAGSNRGNARRRSAYFRVHRTFLAEVRREWMKDLRKSARSVHDD